MESFTVTKIIDGDTFDVQGWTWNGKSGTRVRAYGYNTPEVNQPGYESAKQRLESIIAGNSWTVQLGEAHTIDTYGRLVCDVFIDDIPLANYFPEYPI